MEELRNSTSRNNLISMNGGNGPLSYAKNSSYQRSAVDGCKELVAEAIAENLDLKRLPCSTPFRIADLGCSTGPNTFIAVQIIIEAVEKAHESNGFIANIPEFQVYFNDNVYNDFNTLFSSLPPDRRYFAVGTPGSFDGSLFPKGLLSEAEVHSFNLPIYYASPCELEDLVKRMGYFTIEKAVPTINKIKHNITMFDYRICIMHIRVGTEKLIEDHFGSEIMDDLFDRFADKVAVESSFIFKQEYLDNFIEQFTLLKRRVTN